MCVHYWICPEPDSPTCICKCKYCGIEREMFNYIEYNIYQHMEDITKSNKVEQLRPNNIEAILTGKVKGRPTY